MVRHTTNAVQLCTMASGVAVGIGIKLTFVCLFDSGNASISAEYDMIDEVGVTHNSTKITPMFKLCKHRSYGVTYGDSHMFSTHPLALVLLAMLRITIGKGVRSPFG